MKNTAADLLTSAKLFAAEAMTNAVQAHEDQNTRWAFAVLHLVTALEHAVKCRLAQIHPAFIRESFESKRRTVNLETAFDRLTDTEIGKIKLSEKDALRLKRSVKLRNAVAHGLVGENARAIEAKFFETFPFVLEFFWHQLGVKLFELVNSEVSNSLKSIAGQVRELERRANDTLSKTEVTWLCTECGKNFLVERQDAFHCLFCRSDEPLHHCEQCSESIPRTCCFDADELFDWGWAEGQPHLISDYGVVPRKVCEVCWAEIQEYVEHERHQAQYWEDAEAFYLSD